MRTALFLAALSAFPGLYAQAPPAEGNGLDTQLDRYLTSIARGLWEARAAKIAAIRTQAGIEARQAYIRARLVEEIGGFPEKTPLHPRITGTLDRGDYKVEKLIFESQPHRYVTANVFVPVGGKAPYPAVLGTAGHSAEGKAYELYQRVWVSLARRGFVVLAYDPPGQGERLEYLDAAGKSRLNPGGTAEHSMEGLQCLLTGTSVARYFVWDGIRAFDYLLTRPDVDGKRIAVTGNSGGGTQSAYLAAFEPRLAAAAPSCYLTSWEKLWAGPGPQDAEQNFVDFLKDGLDFPDFLIAFAPKPIQMATATRDFFPIDGAKATFAEARRIFELMGAGDHAGFFEFDDTHGWSQPRRQATYRWLAKWLQGREDDGAEPQSGLDTARDLQASETGQVVTTFRDAETVQSLNAALAGRLHAQRGAAHGGGLLSLVRERLRLANDRGGAPAFKQHAESSRKDYRVETVEIQSEAGIAVPALVFVPSGGAARKPAVVSIDPAGKSVDTGEGGPVEALVREGNIVISIDPRGWGESAPRPKSAGGYTTPYQTAMRALLVGRNMPGMQTLDVLRAFDYLKARPDVNGARVSITAKGKGGILGLYAAVLEPRIASVTAIAIPESYMSIVRMKMPEEIADLVVPGVLRDFDLPDLVRALGSRCIVR